MPKLTIGHTLKSRFVVLAQKLEKLRYARTVSRVVHSDPVDRGVLPFTLLSMVHKRDVRSYLLAVTSFTRFLNPRRIVMVADPTIDSEDMSVLSRLIPHIEIRRAEDFRHPALPIGGCWERLFAISGYADQDYVIQLDADTVTLRDPAEVGEMITSRRAFVLAGGQESAVMTVAESVEFWRQRIPMGGHIQERSERGFLDASVPADDRYVRGCAGFSGFPAGGDYVSRVLEFSARMQAHLGRDWSSWGTEQVASNYLAANSPSCAVLPFPRYGSPPDTTLADTFCHFIGHVRFASDLYRRAAVMILGN